MTMPPWLNNLPRPNQAQVTSVIRQLLLTFGGVLVGKGYVSDVWMTSIVGIIIDVGTGYWAIRSRSTDGLIAAAAALPQVSRIVTTDEIAKQVSARLPTNDNTVVSYEMAATTPPPAPKAA